MTPDDASTPRPKTPPASNAAAPSPLRTMIRGLLLVIALGLAGLYFYAMSNPSQSIALTIVNGTGVPLVDVRVANENGAQESKLGDLAAGGTVESTVPLMSNLVLEFSGPDDLRFKSTYPYEHNQGVGHKMTITLVKGSGQSTDGRQVESKFSVMFGGEVAYVDQIDDMEVVLEPLSPQNAGGGPVRNLPPPSATMVPMSTDPTAPDLDPSKAAAPEPKTQPESKPEATPEPKTNPEAPKAP
ncbi:MAG: hypothetical protein AB7I30_21145 [Isosphaeraceae bacterium]